MTSLFQTASGEWHWASVWALVGWLVAGGLLVGSLRINRNDRIAAFQREQVKNAELIATKSQLVQAHSDARSARELAETVTRYQGVAKLNAVGKTEIISASQRISKLTIESETPISKLMMPTIVQGEGSFDFQETDEAISTYRRVIAEYPDFPFAHYALAKALSLRDDPEWRTHARNAVAILERTTSLPEHQSAHAECLKLLRDNLRTPAERNR